MKLRLRSQIVAPLDFLCGFCLLLGFWLYLCFFFLFWPLFVLETLQSLSLPSLTTATSISITAKLLVLLGQAATADSGLLFLLARQSRLVTSGLVVQ